MAVAEEIDEKKAMDLPDECWELIFKRLGHHNYLDSMSLVCKRFLAISNSLRHSLTISHPQILIECDLSKLFGKRFTHLKIIHINGERMSPHEFNSIVVQIARSGELVLNHLEQLHLSGISNIAVSLEEGLRELSLLNLNKLKTLTCKSCVLRDTDVAALMNSLSGLEELDIMQARWDRVGTLSIEELGSALKNLRKISIQDVCVSDPSLALSHNCLLLSEGAVASLSVDERNAGFALRHCLNLTSLSVNRDIVLRNLKPQSFFTMENSISCARALCALEFCRLDLSWNTLLVSIAEAHLPSLKKLRFISCRNLTFSGLSLLLHQYQSLNELTLKGACFLTDQNMIYLSKFLRNLTHINLHGCLQLTGSTFFCLARSCPFLVDIGMQSTGIGQEGNIGFADLQKNSHIQCLNLYGNYSLNDESLTKIGYICPNVKKLDLTDCPRITKEGVGEILKSCSSITHFIINGSKLEMVLGKDSEHSELNIEVLEASNSHINDKGMTMIAMRCPNLLQLKLQHCRYIWLDGLREVVGKCVKLMEIDLTMCKGLFLNVYEVLFTRPSLRKVNTPGCIDPTEDERNLSMRLGCRLCDEIASDFRKKKMFHKAAHGHFGTRKYGIAISAASSAA